MAFIADYLGELKKQSARGRCLHFSDNTQCNKIISAHSIQKSGQLNNIAESGHVYRLNAEFSTLRKTDGIPIPKKIGVRTASTFHGFCKDHDNSLFKSIDTETLGPNKQQIALYAYRCLCREYFVKENAVAALKNTKGHPELTKDKMAFLEASLIGQTLGLNGLKYHKALYDKALLNQNYDEFEFTYFTSTSDCPMHVSGLLCPDYDFCGRQLQDLGDWNSPRDLITFFTAPLSDGWAFGFGWHASSNQTCIPYLQSLAERYTEGQKIEDALLRLTFACCENHAFRISWWDHLAEEQKLSILKKIWVMTNPILPVQSSYLMEGCEGIASWTYENVHTTLNVVD